MTRLIRLHLIDDGTAFDIRLRQAPQMTVEVAFDLTLGLGEETQVPFVTGNTGHRTQRERARIKQRI